MGLKRNVALSVTREVELLYCECMVPFTCSFSDGVCDHMGVGRIFSTGTLEDFSKIFLGGPKVEKFGLSNAKLRKQPVFSEIFKIQGGLAPLPSLPTPMCDPL